MLRRAVIKVVANEDTMLRTHCCGHKCFPVCPCVQHLLRTQKMFLIFVRNIWCPQQMFPRLRGMDTKQMFCVPLFCPPRKHQCVLVCHHLKNYMGTKQFCFRRYKIDLHSCGFLLLLLLLFYSYSYSYFFFLGGVVGGCQLLRPI